MKRNKKKKINYAFFRDSSFGTRKIYRRFNKEVEKFRCLINVGLITDRF